MPHASRTHRTLGLLAAGSIGAATVVIGAPGIAAAAVPTWSASGSGTATAVPAGICGVRWTVVGGGAGLASDETPGEGAGAITVVTPVQTGDVFTLHPGGRGTDADADTLTPGTGGTTTAPVSGLAGGDGTADGSAAGGGGGAASAVVLDGQVVVQTPGSRASGDLGGAGGAEYDGNIAVGAGEFEEETFDSSGDPGSITGEGVPCTPATPWVNYVEELDRALRLDFVPDESGQAPIHHIEYTLDGGTTWTTLTGVTVQDGRSSGTIGGLTNGTTYSVQLRAVAANGAASEPSIEMTGRPYAKATAPTDVRVETGPGTLTVSWGASTAGTFPIVGYEVDVVWSDGERGGGRPLCRPASGALTCTGEAQPGVTHDVVVAALDESSSQGEAVKVTSGVVPPSAEVPESDGDLVLPEGQNSSVVAGSDVTLAGTGFDPQSTVTLLVYSTPRILSTVTSDADGAISATVTIPQDLPPGRHTLVATGSGQGEVHTLTLPITVEAGLAYTGTDVAVPALGGVAALVVGSTLLVVSRRRRPAAA